MRHPPLNYLLAFEAAVRLGSFKDAATELNCTPAAVSQRIRGLEAIYGRQLFKRLPNGVQPTEAAMIHVDSVAGALEILQTVARDFATRRHQSRVLVSLPVTFATIWLAARIKDFVLDHPGIDVRFNGTIWNDPNAETADFRIELFERSEVPSGAIELTADNAHVVCAPGLLAEMAGPRPGIFFPRQPLIHLLAKHDFWARWLRDTQARQIGNGTRLEVDTAIAGLEIARHGTGIAVGLDSQIAPYLESGELVKPFAEPINIELCHVILPTQKRRLSRHAATFIDFLLCQARPASPA